MGIRLGVDGELRTEGNAGAGVALAEDALSTLIALPDDDEVARGADGYDRSELIVRRIGIDAELGADGITLRPSGAGDGHEHNEEEEGSPAHSRLLSDNVRQGILNDSARSTARSQTTGYSPMPAALW